MLISFGIKNLPAITFWHEPPDSFTWGLNFGHGSITDKTGSGGEDDVARATWL